MKTQTNISIGESDHPLPVLSQVTAPQSIRRIARILAVILVMFPILLLLVPWQQNVKGYGRVVAYAPLERQQSIQAPVSGRVVHCWVIEGTIVKKGDKLLELEDQDAGLLNRLQQQYEAAQQKRNASMDKVSASLNVVAALEDARELTIAAAESLVDSAVNKVVSAENSLLAIEADLEQKRLDFIRQSELAREGIVSELTAQKAERDFKSAEAKVKSERAKVASVRAEEAAKRSERDQKGKEAQAKVDKALAELNAAQGDVALAEKDLADARVKLERQKTQVIRAPRDGRVFRLLVNPGAELVKQGDPMLTLIPDTTSLAVELWVDGNDAPLITRNRAVRLQFEGWPAVQFSGWPSVAVGTFGGRVSLVDAQDDGYGRFRILVVPDSEDQPWPDHTYLRQGVRTNGWVLLDQVRAGYEIWRQLNGFPPTVALKQLATADSKGAKK